MKRYQVYSKMELGGDIITSFIGLRAKLYRIDTLSTFVSKAKGVTKSVTQTLTYDNYESALMQSKSLRLSMNVIKSECHNLYS